MNHLHRAHIALLGTLAGAAVVVVRLRIAPAPLEWLFWLVTGLSGGTIVSLIILSRLDAMGLRVGTPVIKTDAAGRVSYANQATAALFGSPVSELIGQRVQVGDDIAWPERLAAIAELTQGVAHELRSPLTAVRNAAQLGLMFADPEKKDALFREVISQADKLNESIDDLTVFTTTDAGELAPVRLDQVVAAALAHIKGILIMHDIKVDCAFSGAFPPILGDEQQLKQAVLNIFNNCVRAMPNGGALIIRNVYHSDRGMVELTIGDTGAGIAPKDVPRVFRPFAARGNSSIGLTIASQIIVQRHSGLISCQSSIGGGTRISVLLPVFEGQGTGRGSGQLSADNAD